MLSRRSRRARADVYQVTLDHLRELPRSDEWSVIDVTDMNCQRRLLADALCEISGELSSVGSVQVAKLVASIAAPLRSGDRHDPAEVVTAALLMADQVDPDPPSM